MNKHTAAIVVVLLGWTFESATIQLLQPSPPLTLHDYTAFYINATQLRNGLFLLSAILLYNARGSLPIFALMGFNLAAVLMNIAYLDTSNYALISPWRSGYFAPAYRAAEITIITWAAWNVRTQILNYASRFCYRCRFMADRGRLHRKREQAPWTK